MSKFIDIYGSAEKFEVNNIFCIGKNYMDHIKEFGQMEAPKQPVVFLKPNSAIMSNNSNIVIPSVNGNKISGNVHYETEMVIAIGKDGMNLKETEVEEHIFGYAIGLDLTLRDVQVEAKKAGLPWATSKGFMNSAPVGNIVLREEIKDPMNCDIELQINNIRKQFSNARLMILNIYELISYISTVFGISKGDLIYTGTPEGVGKIKKGENLKAILSNKYELNVRFDG
ncbi:MAG: fumarylacetoacetate hydrolase family protein [Ignavibacteriota bacterium]|nr:fumarylacetoacetate hydrolase family protein [Ignavibacteriota bacterium]